MTIEHRCYGSVIAVAGPTKEIQNMKESFKMFDKIYTFDVPDDYGEFPDTTGYTREDFDKIESIMEDPALLPYMTKCVDAVMEYNNTRSASLEKLGYIDIEAVLQAPKFGGRIFAAVGFVKAFEPQRIISPKSMAVTKMFNNIIRNNSSINRHERRMRAKLARMN